MTLHPEVVKNARLAEALRHAWKLSGRPDPFEGDDAWGGFALVLRTMIAETSPHDEFIAVLTARLPFYSVEKVDDLTDEQRDAEYQEWLSVEEGYEQKQQRLRREEEDRL